MMTINKIVSRKAELATLQIFDNKKNDHTMYTIIIIIAYIEIVRKNINTCHVYYIKRKVRSMYICAVEINAY